jgi:hypothetical protein
MDVNELVRTVFSGLSPLVIEDVADEGERIVVRARTPLDTAVCPVCGTSSGRVHGYHWRTVADVPVDSLLRIPLPTGRAPRVIGVDDFALRRRQEETFGVQPMMSCRDGRADLAFLPHGRQLAGRYLSLRRPRLGRPGDGHLAASVRRRLA